MEAYEKRMSETEEKIGATKKKMSELNAGDMALISKQLAAGLILGGMIESELILGNKFSQVTLKHWLLRIVM